MRCCRIIITPEAMKFAKANRTDREISKNKPKYVIHYRGSESGAICLTLDSLEQVVRLCKFPSRKLKDNFLNDFLATLNFPNESKLLYDWLYKPREHNYYDWRYEVKNG